jgi:hypothetical protein
MKNITFVAAMIFCCSAGAVVPVKIPAELKTTVPAASLPTPSGALPGTDQQPTSRENAGVARTKSVLKDSRRSSNYGTAKTQPAASNKVNVSPAAYTKLKAGLARFFCYLD